MFARYGSPSIIRSDMGTEFVNTIMKELTLVFNTKHITTIGDRPQSNGIAERANREIIRHLTYVVTNKKLSDMWSLGLPLVQRILNAKIGPYGYSPSSIIFGNSVDLCRGLMSPLQQDKQVVDFNDYMSKLIDYQIKAIQVSQKFIATDGDRKAPVIQQVITFNIGDYVLVKNKSVGVQNNLSYEFSGPYLIRQIDHNNYHLENLCDKKIIIKHVSDIKLFHYSNEEDLLSLAANNNNEVVVTKIIEHKNIDKKKNFNNKTNYKFLVEFIDDTTTWLNYHDINNNAVLDEYLTSHEALARIINK